MAFIGNTPTTQAFIPAVDFFSGNGSTTAFTLSRPVASVAQIQAVVENVPQMPGDAYTVSGNTITFTSAPASGTNNIYVYYTSPITQVIAPSPGTVGTAALAPGLDVTAGLLSVAGNNISAVNSLGFRNRLINGGMVIDQRNAGASVTPANGAYTLDRWAAFTNGAGVYTVQQSSTAPAGFTNSLLCTVTTIDSSVTGTDYYMLQHKVEGFNSADLAWGSASAASVTLSFWVRSSITGTYSVKLGNSASDRFYIATYTISAANTWEQKTITLSGDTSGTWVTNNGTGIEIRFGLAIGSSFTSSTIGSWAAGNSFGATTASNNWIGTNGATFYITGVQLEAGTVASPFERRDYGRELMMCQRYYWRLKQSDTSNQFTFGCGAVGSSKDTFFIVNSPVQMRSAPTATQSGTVNINYNASAYAKTSIGGQYAGTITTRITWNDASLVAGGATWFDFASGAYIEFSSEL